MKNRIYKFRAWDKKNKKFVKHLSVNIVSKKDVYSKIGFLISDIEYCNYNKVEKIPDVNKDITLMQFTGLKDKNGKELYERDILKIDNDNLIVYFDKEALTYTLKLNSKIYIYMGALTSNRRKSIEVIGNIYENKNLLNNN